MLKIEEFVTPSPEQWEIVIKGMRNPKNSWDRMDSTLEYSDPYNGEPPCDYTIGPNDHKLASTLVEGGPVHSKFRRMLPVHVTINAPLYWWKEFDTYKVGTVENSCSTMHKIHSKEFTLEDFSTEHLIDTKDPEMEALLAMGENPSPLEDLINYDIPKLNMYRSLFLETKDKKWWWQMIQRLPTNYNQKRTVMLNYEVLANMYYWRKNHKLDEWHTFCHWIEELPYSELITGYEED